MIGELMIIFKTRFDIKSTRFDDFISKRVYIINIFIDVHL